jgi:hypothetical protein
MKLILKKAVANLGEAGEVVTVKAGYGRNFLLPQGLAYEASEANMKRLEEEHRRAEERSGDLGRLPPLRERGYGDGRSAVRFRRPGRHADGEGDAKGVVVDVAGRMPIVVGPDGWQ